MNAQRKPSLNPHLNFLTVYEGPLLKFARACFLTVGRGVLVISEPEPEALVKYELLDHLRAAERSSDLIELVEHYNPKNRAIVQILNAHGWPHTYELGDTFDGT